MNYIKKKLFNSLFKKKTL